MYWAKEKNTKERPNCHYLTQTGTKPSSTSHRTRNSAQISQLHNLLSHSLQQIFILNMSSPSKKKKPHLRFQRFLIFLSVRYYCISLSLESFIWDYTHVPKHSCSTSWLLYFIPREKPASIRHPISCSLSKGCFGPFICLKTGFKWEGVMETVAGVISCCSFFSVTKNKIAITIIEGFFCWLKKKKKSVCYPGLQSENYIIFHEKSSSDKVEIDFNSMFNTLKKLKIACRTQNLKQN